MRKNQLFIWIYLLCSTLATLAQTGEFKGIVQDESGWPVANASVQLKGTKLTVMTNRNGEFSFRSIPVKAVLAISSIGYEPLDYEVNSLSVAPRIIVKRSAKELQEVELVSSGYQSLPRERVTGSFVKVDNALLNQQTGTNILKRLDGVTSGLYFNIGKDNGVRGTTNISIRGLSTIEGPLDPLVVLNGFIYEGSIDNINPNDVEEITVLKDAAAASIWGARAGNGVIIITTKKGKLNQKLQVSFNSNVIMGEKPDFNYLPEMTSADYIDVEQFLFNRGFFNSAINSRYRPITPAVNVFLQKKRGVIGAADSASQVDALKAINAREQYDKYVYQPSLTQQYSLNVRGGSQVNSYTFSLGYDKINSDLAATKQKLNVRMGNIFQATKDLAISADVYYTKASGVSGKSGYNTIAFAGRRIPYLQLADENGIALPVANVYKKAYTDTAGEGRLLDWSFYPLENYKYQKSRNDLQELFATLGVKYKIISGVDFELDYQYQNQEAVLDRLYEEGSFYNRNLVNTYSQLDHATGIVTYIIPRGDMQVSDISSTHSHTGRAQLKFHNSWRHHTLNVLLGAEAREAQSQGESNSRYGFSRDPLYGSRLDYFNSYPNYVTGNYETIPDAPSFSNTINRFVSVYFNGAYSYRNRYAVTASARRDGSNIFGLTTNDKWKPLWSVGGLWTISNESFFKSDFFSSLKLRLTYGYSGNVDLSRTAVAVGSYFSSPLTNFPFARINTMGNPSLRWEKIGQLNLGIDFEIRQGLLRGSLEYYRKSGTDLYGLSPYDYTTGGNSREMIRNVANMRGTGIDLEIHSRNLNGVFKWETGLLFNFNNAWTTKYDGSEAQHLRRFLGSGTSISPVVGQPLYAIAAYRWGGLNNQGNPQGYVNGELSTDYQAIFEDLTTKSARSSIVFKGPANPTVFGSLINSFSWKDITLSVNIAYRFGYYFRKSTIRYTQLVSNGSGHSDFAKRWQQPGDELHTNVPAFVYPNNSRRDTYYTNAEIHVLRGDHMRLQYINLDYRVWKGISLYGNAANLGILWRANNERLDPDYPNVLQPVRTWTIGLRANF